MDGDTVMTKKVKGYFAKVGHQYIVDPVTGEGTYTLTSDPKQATTHASRVDAQDACDAYQAQRTHPTVRPVKRTSVPKGQGGGAGSVSSPAVSG